MDKEINFHDYFIYDETSPSCLRWAVDRRKREGTENYNVRKGDVAGCVKNDIGRWRVGLNSRNHFVSRVIWVMFNEPIPNNMVIDHIDRDRTNNKISNLRLVSRKENSRNCSKKRNNSTGVTGVSRGGRYWDDPIYHYDKYYEYYSATWRDDNGKNHAKHFSISKYGEDAAFEMACAHRKRMIAEMNAEGCGYSDGHGT